ncbi:MAG: LPS O-antigen length regulator [Halomonadaceae bacterium]|nr:MAG: LPS O-antigen length regulator [Halomonadaceae bacterium]
MTDTPQPEHSQPPSRASDDEIDLIELFRALWAGKWWISGVTLVAAVAGIFYALAQPDEYTASTLLAPVSDGGSGGMAAMASQYGGLASLAGVNLGGGEAGKRQITMATLKSRRFLTEFIQRHDLKVPLLASKGWDMANQQWLIDPERYDRENNTWLAQDGANGDPEPSDWQALKAFQGMFSVAEDRDSGMVTLTLQSRSPEAAQQWLTWLVQDINNTLKAQQMAETRRNVAYLEQQLESTSVSGMRQVFFSLIEEQSKTLMLAELDAEFAFKVIDPPVVPEERSAPNRALIVILAVMLGGMLSTFAVLVAYALRQRP